VLATASMAEAAPLALEDHVQEAEKRLRELYDIHDFLFLPDHSEKQKMLEDGVAEVLAALEAAGEGATGKEKAKLAYIKGRALDAYSVYSAEAEACLSRAVKLNPGDIEAWNALGHCFWKKKDLAGARNCFLEALTKGSNVKSLRQLSMLLRQLPAANEARATEHLRESLARAKTAVALCVTDPESWYNLGNAHVAHFFSVTHSMSDLDKALQAYARAEANGGEANPDLYFNRAKVYQYQQDYSAAARCYRAAAELDPQLPAADAARDLERAAVRSAELVARKGQLKPKRLAQHAAQLAASSSSLPRLPAGLEYKPLSELSEGANAGAALVLKAIMPGGGNSPPEQVLAIDAAGACIMLSLYQVGRAACEKLGPKDTLVVTAPYMKTVRCGVGGDSDASTAVGSDDDTAAAGKSIADSSSSSSSKQQPAKEAVYVSIQVADDATLLVNGVKLQGTFDKLRASFFDK
jgi:tetratricopeptide (TPR) repeat protein